MKLLTYEWNGKRFAGVLTEDGTRALSFAELGLPFGDMNAMFDHGGLDAVGLIRQAVKRATATGVALEQVKLLAPLPHPKRDVICLGLNYIGHSMEMAKQRGEDWTGQRKNPVYFSKRIYEATGDQATASTYAEFATAIDFGVELGVVIGSDCRNVSIEEAMDYVFGYTIINDLTIRDMDKLHRGPWMGKSVDGYLPMGPWIVTADEFERIPALKISAYVNGVMQQYNRTDRVSFLPDYIISDLSQVMTLRAGTIISTGSPGGELLGVETPVSLQAGDECRCEIEGIGTLTTIMTH